MQNGYQELRISGCRLKKAAAAYFKCEALPVFGAANPMVPEELDKKGDRESLDTFEKKWACYNVPMKAVQPNGYDVIMASGMLGFLLPEKIDEKSAESIILLRDNQFWNNCQKSIFFRWLVSI